MICSPLNYKITSFNHDGRVRFNVQEKESFSPSLPLSIYECYLSQSTDSPNTVLAELQNLNYFFTWAKETNLSLPPILLSGQPIETISIRAFSHWLHLRGHIYKTGSQKTLSKTTSNKCLSSVSRMICWFIEQYSNHEGNSTERILARNIITSFTKEAFKDQNKKNIKLNVAPDLTEEEIREIERFLNPNNRKNKTAKTIRDYLMWRLVIEFGLRLGELLALRIQDCPQRAKNYIQIVRIEDRGDDYFDPRMPYAPRPKTLSRNLGFILKNTPIPGLINDYITRHRFRIIERHGRKTRQPIIDNPDFLILSHHNGKGAPLSIQSAEDIAKDISRATGIDFHWHLGRHAFYNRAYSAIVDNPNFKDRKTDLVYFGGWQSEDSLEIYTRRARRYRAEKALAFWQEGCNEWDALK